MDQGSNYIRQDIDRTNDLEYTREVSGTTSTSTAIRQEIDSTREALTEKLGTLETKAREAFDIKQQVAERPWVALGAAIAAGYVLGSLGGSDNKDYRYTPSSDFKYKTSDIDNQYRYSPSTSGYNNESSQYRYSPSSPAAPSYSGASGSYNSSSQSYAGQESQNKSLGESIKSQGQGFLSQFDNEIDELKVAAISTVRDLLRSMVSEYIPAMGKQLDKMQGQTSGSGMSQNLSGNSSSYSPSSSSSSASPSTYSSVSDRDNVTTYNPR